MTKKRDPRIAANRSERGNTLVEFALAFAVLFPLLMGAFQFGSVFSVYNSLHNAVRSGARYASLRSYDSSTATPSEAFKQAITNMVLYGDPAGGTTPILPGLTPENVSLTVSMEENVPKRMTVSVVDFELDALFTSFSLNGRPSVSFRYGGRIAP